MSELDILAQGAMGMERQRTLLDLAARNVAAAQASSPAHPYHRLIADFDDGGVAHVRESGEPAEALTEMVRMLDAQRAYEANASIFDVGKRIAERTIELGRI